MSGATTRRARWRPVCSIVLVITPIVSLAVVATPAGAGSGGTGVIPLPAPVHGVDPLTSAVFKFRPDRLKKSVVPGPTSDREDIDVAVGPSGAAADVTDTQHLVIRGAGNYVIRELGPARAADGIGDTVPPVLELGTVVWQGFSPGRRALAARLTLDAGIESARLPLRVQLALRDRAGKPRSLEPGAVSPVDGTVDVTLVNQTKTTKVLPAGAADPGALAQVMDQLVAAADHPRVGVPPVPGAGLPRHVAGTVVGQQSVDVVAPLRITGTVTVPGAHPAITGPGTTPVAAGVAVSGTLAGSVTFRVPVRAGQRLALDLHVQPWPDPRTMQPPAPARTWRAWARQPHTTSELSQATGLMVGAVAAATHDAEYSPYLQADAPGPDLSTFRYVVAPATTTRRAVDSLTPHPVGIVMTVVAVLAVVGNAALLRRLL